MKFLAKDEASSLEKKLRREIAEHSAPKFVLYYESGGDRDYSDAANAIAQATGTFSEATLLFQWCLSGDGWVESSPNNDRWQGYKRWRAANGEDRRLYEAPGHRFEPTDIDGLSRTIGFALELGWDALVAAKPGRQLLFLSHDDRLEIYRGFTGGMLVRKLTSLGYWRRADR
jgi:hypothetical protein